MQPSGLNLKQEIIDPAIQEVMKAVTARYTAEELINQKTCCNVQIEMKEALINRMLEVKIAVDCISIVSFSFSQTFTDRY